jgi:hypothetical protein
MRFTGRVTRREGWVTDFLARVEAQRREIYRPGGVNLLRSAEDALDFVNKVGFCLLFAHRTLELPNLWGISEGRPWLWKDELSIQKQLYYGKRFRKRAGFVALRLLPALYALTPTAEFRGDRFALYRRGYISAEANRIAGAVLAKGPLSTRDLRRTVGMAGDRHRYRFSKALAEAEEMFLVVKGGTTRTKHAAYTYVWDSFARFWSEVAGEGSGPSHEEAGVAVINRYVRTTVAATTKTIADTLSLNESFVGFIAGRLVGDGTLARIEDEGQVYLVAPDVLESLLA